MGGYGHIHTPAFGFWPNSGSIYISATSETTSDGQGNPVFDPPTSAIRPGTWLFQADGTFAGWLSATRLADTEKGGAMIFDAGDGKTLEMSPTLKITDPKHFKWSDGEDAEPLRIFPDLHLGLFWKGKGGEYPDQVDRQLILARW